MADKAPQAFRTISEVSELLDTPPHVLRFWESKFTQLKPVKRAGGRRYYRPTDVALLAGIRKLLHDDGMTIRGVQKLLREQGVRHVSGLAELTTAGDESATLYAIPTAEVPTAQAPPAAEGKLPDEEADRDQRLGPADDSPSVAASAEPSADAPPEPVEAAATPLGPAAFPPPQRSDEAPSPAAALSSRPSPAPPARGTAPDRASTHPAAPDLFSGLDMADAESLLPETADAPAPQPAADPEPADDADGRRPATRLRSLDRPTADTAAWEAVAERVAALHARLAAAAGRPPA